MTEEQSNLPTPKLLDLVRGKIRVKHYSIRTKQAYVDWIKRYIYHFDKVHPKNRFIQKKLNYCVTGAAASTHL